MKASNYNVLFNYEGLDVGFNGVTQEFIILDELMLELYRNGEQRKQFGELKEVYPQFYDFLVEKGFLIGEDINQFEQLKELSLKVDNRDDSYHLIINPTMNCNFKCWYCYETHIKDSKMDSDTKEKVISFVKRTIEDNPQIKKFSISWFGGEPLLYFDKVIRPILSEVVPYMKSKEIFFSCGITTNGLLINQERLAFCKEHYLDSFQITLDGHRERHDKVRFISGEKGSYDKILDNIFLIAQNGLTTSVRVNCSVETLPGIPAILEDFERLDTAFKKNIHFDFHKVWQVSEDIEDNLRDYRLQFRDRGFRVRGGIYDTLTQSCYADKKNHVTINYNGDVFKCTARDFKKEDVEGTLNEDGTLDWNGKYHKRLSSKFKNPPCFECKIFPICGGGCSQHAIENEGRDYCVHDFNEESKTKAVIGKFLETISNNELEFTEI